MTGLRSSKKPENTKLSVIDCKTFEIHGYDGRVLSQKAKIEVDEATTREGIIELINEFSRASKAGELERNDILDARMSAAHLEYMSWFDVMEEK